MKKIAIITLAAILVLSSVGVGLAKWFDRVDVQGTVTTGSLNIEIVDTSCTYVYKDINGIYEMTPPAGTTYYAEKTIVSPALLADATYPGLLLVSSACAVENNGDDGKSLDTVTVTFENLFPNADSDVPAIPFIADVVIHYDGTIPAELVISELKTTGDFFTKGGTVVAKAYWATKNANGTYTEGAEVTGCTQVHCCQYIKIDFTAVVPQNDLMMSTSGAFSCAIEAQQWDAGCPSPTPNEPTLTPVVPTCTPTATGTPAG